MFFTKSKTKRATGIIIVVIFCLFAVQEITYRQSQRRRDSKGAPTLVNPKQRILVTKAPLEVIPAKNHTGQHLNITSNSKTRSIPMYSDKVIGPLPYNFTLTNGHVCMQNATSQRDVFLLILVKCRPGGSSMRALIRKTWGGVRKVDGRQTLTMFLLGKTVNSTLNDKVANENRQHRDIIQGNFVDSYLNLTHKTMMGWRWASKFCSGAEYVASADDDVLLNVHTIVRRLVSKIRNNYAEGFLQVGSKPYRGRSKWHTSLDLYPEPTYPPYFSGVCYVLSGDVAVKVYKESMHVRFLQWDDVYVGMVLNKLNVTMVHEPRYLRYKESYRASEAAIDNGLAVLVGDERYHAWASDAGHNARLLKIWEKVAQKHKARNYTRV
ncbi:beta-1,3-galactosyltransferase 1-like [Acanthaster planci]|uniref:Hexosyltransferase n=1 Tax=Acanthaster planci TaxID=133434 RepID=A0A8B7XL37_ACAPL|nr:beta-1,3-galactosyltransferase 1-like [Acanthaster planci]